MTDCLLRQVTMDQCSARYLQLSGCGLKDCHLTDSVFTGGAFTGVTLQRTETARCDFDRCDLRGTDLGGMDLSTCQIEGCTWSPDKLKNLTVNLQQAVELSRLLGLNIVP